MQLHVFCHEANLVTSSMPEAICSQPEFIIPASHNSTTAMLRTRSLQLSLYLKKKKKSSKLILLPKQACWTTESFVPSIIKVLVIELLLSLKKCGECRQPFQKCAPHPPTVCSVRSARQSSMCLPLDIYLVPLTCCFHSRLERLSTYLKIHIHLPFPLLYYSTCNL